MPLVPEYAARLAQLKAGNIHRLIGPDPRPEDVFTIKGDEKRLDVYQTDLGADGTVMIFGQLPAASNPFQDERVRRAVSMGIDRDTWLDAIYAISSLGSRGLPVEGRWNSHLAATWEGAWLDPKSNDFGPNGKYFRYDVAEAKKLLAAAGHAHGLNVTSNYPADRVEFRPLVEPIDGMMQEIGIRIRVNNPDYATQYIPRYRDGQGQYEGWTYASAVTGAQDPVSALAGEYWSKAGGTFRGFTTDPSKPKAGDPDLDRLIEKARLESEPKALNNLVFDIQRHLAGKMWGLALPGGATGFSLAWPAVQNHFTWRGVRQNTYGAWNAYQVWVDKNQPPLA
jgi:ABC-type transport system substrate-binding protein